MSWRLRLQNNTKVSKADDLDTRSLVKEFVNIPSLSRGNAPGRPFMHYIRSYAEMFSKLWPKGSDQRHLMVSQGPVKSDNNRPGLHHYTPSSTKKRWERKGGGSRTKKSEK